METLKKSKRPLVNVGNSRITQYRRKIQALENQKKNRQTLFQLLSKEKVDIQDEEINEKNDQSIKYTSFIDQIKNKLKMNDQRLTPGYKIRLKAV